MTAAEKAPDLFLYSLSEFAPIIAWLIDQHEVRSVAEVGAEFGQLTQLLLNRLSSGQLHQVFVIDPAPKQALRDLAQDTRRGLTLLQQGSLEALDDLPPLDCYLIDGDHNYHTVINELRSIEEKARPRGRFPLVILHDVGWPCARRDMYYSPNSIPEGSRHPYDYHLGTTPQSNDLIPGGFRSNGQFAFAMQAGGKQNGVLTAVEDFLDTRPDLVLKTIPAILGLGIIVPRHTEIFDSPAFLSLIEGLLKRMEANRIDLYLRVLELQDELSIAHHTISHLQTHPLRNITRWIWQLISRKR